MKLECCLIIRCPRSVIYPDFVQHVNFKQMFYILQNNSIAVIEDSKGIHLLSKVIELQTRSQILAIQDKFSLSFLNTKKAM